MATTTGKGNCRIMLFGDYLHTAGSPAIACAIDKSVTVDATKIKESTDIIFDDKVFKETIKRSEQPEHILCKILTAVISGLDEYEQKQVQGIKFVINSDLPPKKGFGYSAALSTAFASSLNKLLTFGWHDEQIIEHAKNGEIAITKNPNKLDVTCATEGKSTWFEKGKDGEKDTARTLTVGKPLFLVITSTGDKNDTIKMQTAFEKWKNENPKELKNIIVKQKKLLAQAKVALKFGEMSEIGKLLNQNQEFLRTMNTTIQAYDTLVKTAIEKGAYGAKISNLGQESFAIALCENEAMQDKIIAACIQKGYSPIKTKGH